MSASVARSQPGFSCFNHRSFGMDATLSNPQSTASPEAPQFKSRPGALAWAFRKSRDGWKAKCKKLKAELKRHTNRVADVSKSREHWRGQAEAAREELSAREAEIAALREQIAALEVKKKSVLSSCP
jgi:septal ring factor EnvC (AmiA/AmiB activator)